MFASIVLLSFGFSVQDILYVEDDSSYCLSELVVQKGQDGYGFLIRLLMLIKEVYTLWGLSRHLMPRT